VQLIRSEIPSELKIRVADVDPDYIRYHVSVSDGAFAGTAEIFGGPELPAEVASALQGFPRSPSDRREVMLGSADPRAAGGYVKFVCSCFNRAGQPMFEFELNDKADRPRNVSAFLKVVAAEVDTFIRALRSLSLKVGASVSIPAAP
jgi:hypothetical protein